MKKQTLVAIPACAAASIAVLAWSGLPSRLIAHLVADRVETASGHRLKVTGPVSLEVWSGPALVADAVTYADSDDPQALRITAERLRVSLDWPGLLAFAPHVTGIEITRPVVELPMVRDRRVSAAADGEPAPDRPSWPVDRVNVIDGAVILSDPRTGAESRMDHVDATLVEPTSPDRFGLTAETEVNRRRVSVKASAEPGASRSAPGSLSFDFRAEASGGDLPPASGSATARFAEGMLSVDALRIEAGPNRFTGQVTIDFAARKPSVFASFETDTLDLSPLVDKLRARGPGSASPTDEAPWSREVLGLDGLNFVDAELKVTADRVRLGAVSLAPVVVAGKLRRGAAVVALAPAALGTGHLAAKLTLDASSPRPTFRIEGQASDIDAAPLVRELADFAGFTGQVSGTVDVGARGASARDIVGSLTGTAGGALRNGRIGGQDLGRTIGPLAARLLTGRDPQEIGSFDMGSLQASLRLDRGVGTTDDIRLDGSPVSMTGHGTVDVPNRRIAFEFSPKLSLGGGQPDQGDQTGASAQSGLGGLAGLAGLAGMAGLPSKIDIAMPFAVDGPWTAPSVHPSASMPTITSGDFKFAPKGQGAGERQPDDIINNIGSLVSDLIANGAKSDPSRQGIVTAPAAGKTPDANR